MEFASSIIARRLAALGAAALLAAATARAQELGPEALVRQVTADVLAAIHKDEALKAGDRRKALALAEEKVLPHVDFREMTRLATGRSWASTSPAQREALTVEFRAMLISTYASAIDAYKGQSMRVLPLKMPADASEVTVRNLYVKPGKPSVPVDYRMSKTPSGWKIVDIVVDGVSLVLTYRTEFDEVARRDGVDALIQRLREKNRTPLSASRAARV